MSTVSVEQQKYSRESRSQHDEYYSTMRFLTMGAQYNIDKLDASFGKLMSAMNSQLASIGKQIEGNKSIIAAKDEQIAAMKETVTIKDEVIAAGNGLIIAKDTEIECLKQRLAAIRGEA